MGDGNVDAVNVVSLFFCLEWLLFGCVLELIVVCVWGVFLICGVVRETPSCGTPKFFALAFLLVCEFEVICRALIFKNRKYKWYLMKQICAMNLLLH